MGLFAQPSFGADAIAVADDQRASLLANAEILPQARQGSYFFNTIGQKRSLRTHTFALR